LFWAYIGGALFSIFYRSINSCYSVAGYSIKELKTFSKTYACLDDFVSWNTACLERFLMLITNKSFQNSFKITYNLLRLNAKKHKSSNSGWNEAAVALILGVQLGGTNTYQGIVSKAPLLGDALRTLEADDIVRTITIMQRTTTLFIIGGVLLVLTF